MRKLNFLSLCFFALLFFNCGSSDDDSEAITTDYTEFLANDILNISGSINNTNIDWQFLPDSNVNSILVAYNLGDGLVRKGAGLQIDNGDGFNLWAPEYNVNSEENIVSIFQPGLKQMGHDDWYFIISLDGVEYESCDTNVNYELEVLQMSDIELFGDTQVFTIWVRLANLDFGDCEENEEVGVLNEAFMHIEFNLDTFD